MKTINSLPKPFFLSFLIILLFCTCQLYATEMNSGQARQLVRKWLEADPRPLGAKLGDKIDYSEHFTNDSGEIVYYIVYLQPQGFVIVSADNLVEPIIGFVEKGHYDPSLDNPLGALVSGDIPNRIAAAKSQQATLKPNKRKGKKKSNKKTFSSSQDKWTKINNSQIQLLASTISDIWVEPLTETTWGQDNIEGYYNTDPFYSYYTPYNYPIGCIAAATAQLIRYHEHGGSYVWSNMPLNPTIGSYTTTQRNAIAQLCYDVAEAVDTTYGSGGSSAYLIDADDELTTTFGYSNSIYCDNFPTNLSNSVLYKMANPNVDAGFPVIFGIRNSTFNYAHAVICDGYGYNSSTLYHHLNMGWDGNHNAWYNLPTVYIASDNNYNVIDVCVYNVFVSGSGEIISGRVTGPGGYPISGVTVTATGSGGPYTSTTNANGIYALVHVPSGTGFSLTASKGLWNFSTNGTTTGTSVDEINQPGSPGNRWGINFTGTTSAGEVEFDKETYWPGDTITITLIDNDISGSNPVLVTTDAGDEETVTLSATSAAGMFTGTIPTATAAISDEDGTVQIDFGDTLTVTYNDADNGTGPATSQDIANTPIMLVDADFTGGTPSGWTIIDGGNSSHTWTTTNPGGRSNSSWTGTFMIADSDAAGSDTTMDEQLITPDFDCTSLESVTLKFSHYFAYIWASNEIGDVDIRVGSGSWQNIERYFHVDTSGVVELDISSIADGQEDVQIRWHFYDSEWGNYWGIDNVQVIGFPPAQVPPEKCSIEGYKFNDTDGNGVWDSGEVGLQGWEIYLDLNDNGQLDPGEPNTMTGTDPNGFYKFSYLDAGTYIVAEVAQTGWTQTCPGGDGKYTIIAEEGSIHDGNNFGNTTAPLTVTISGYVKTATGVGIEGVLISASTDESDTTDENGYYEIMVADNWTGSVTAGKDRYAFNEVYDFSNLTSDAVADFTGYCVYSGGDGTQTNPFQIADVVDLLALGDNTSDYGKYFIQTANISFAGAGPEPGGVFASAVIARSTPGGGDFGAVEFEGVYDGNGFTVSDLSIDATIPVYNYLGLFGKVHNGLIKNLNLENIWIDAEHIGYVGGVAGYNDGGIIDNCNSSVLLNGRPNCSYWGGIIGYNDGSTIRNSKSSVLMEGETNCSYFGGITGFNSDHGIIEKCSASGSISGSLYMAGGLAGSNEHYSVISDCNSSCSVAGNIYLGGLAGENSFGSEILDSCATGNVTGSSLYYYFGGLVGDNHNGLISNCYATGAVSGNREVGGLAGRNYFDGTIINCYARGQVDGVQNVGGLVGINEDIYEGVISYCYATGDVSGTTAVGGLCGYNPDNHFTDPSPIIVSCFWNTSVQTHGVSVGIGINNELVSNVLGKTTSEMQMESTYTSFGWDFELPTWTIWEGVDYPRLAWENALSVDFGLDHQWMYQNVLTETKSRLTADVLITDDPLANSGYTYEWEIILPSDVTTAPSTFSGGGSGDQSWTFVAPGCDEPNGISDLGETFQVRVTVIGNDHGNTGSAQLEFGIALLGDVNNDTVIDVADRSITNAFWRSGSAGPFTLRDCDVNCDDLIDVADRSITNAIWRGLLGSNSIANPCPLR